MHNDSITNNKTQSRQPEDSSDSKAHTEWLISGGELGELIRSTDWMGTPLGPRDRWPQSLRTAVNLVVNSKFPKALLWGPELLLLYNDAYGEIAADKHPNALGRATREVWPEVWHINEPIFTAVMERGETFLFKDKLFHINRHGSCENAYFTLSYDPVHIEDGLVGGVLVTPQETTEGKRVEELLRESEKKYRNLFENMTAEVHFWRLVRDQEGNIKTWRLVDVNPAGLNGWGKTREETIGKTVDEIFPGATEHFMPIVQKIFRDGTPYQWESYFEGTKQHLQMTSVAVDEYFINTGTDITEIKQVELKLRASKELLRRVTDNANVGLTQCSRDWVYLSANPAFAEIAGKPLEQIIGRPIAEVMGVEAMKTVRPYVDRVLRGENVSYEAPLSFSNANPPYLHISYTPDTDDEGQIVGWVSSITDITERKTAEEDLQKAHDELERRVMERTLELQKTHAQLLHAEKLTAIGRLSASIAHEFNNPLQGIMNIIKGVRKRSPMDQEDARLMDLALIECVRMRDLIKSLQEFNQPSSCSMALVDIHTTIDNLLLLGKKEYKTRNIVIEKKYAENFSLVKVIADQFKQVLLNLLNNASDACERGGTITIGTEAYEDHVVVYVKDTGNGIAPDNIGHIFEPFFSTKHESKGTGLGLSVSHGVIQAHGGKIEVESEVGKGSTFSVFLPR